MSPHRSLWLVVRRLIRTSPGRFTVGSVASVTWLALPLLSGLILQALFDAISGQRAATLDAAWWLCAAFVGAETLRGGVFWLGLNLWPYWRNAAATTLRANTLRSILTAPGPASTRLPHSSGEAVARFRDDVHDLVELPDNLVEIAGAVLFAIGALTIMATIHPIITLVLALPLALIAILTQLLRGMIARIHRRARQLGAIVTAFIGETFAGVLAIKTAAAEHAVLERLRDHNRRRRGAAVKDRLAVDMLQTTTGATVGVSIGLVLVLAAPAMRSGDFTVGDFALFTTYIGRLTMLPQAVGRMLYRVPRGIVGTERMTRLMATHENADHLSRRTAIWFHHDAPPALTGVPQRTDPLETLVARGLTVQFDDTGRGVHAVDLQIERGSFTVITGAVGSGKTTVVRALLGLLPLTGGTVWWNGQQVDDPGTFLIPGRVAYAGQVPRLFSETVRENLQLGWPADTNRLAQAIELAAFEQDLADMPDGLETVVGSRGVRLSGGQVQRATAARALVRTPDLLVVDDLSSALDVETEQLLWHRIGTAADHGPSTLLVVSHRRAALERADHIIVLDRGQVTGTGSLTHLLHTCPEMQRLWTEELLTEAQEHSAANASAGGPLPGP